MDTPKKIRDFIEKIFSDPKYSLGTAILVNEPLSQLTFNFECLSKIDQQELNDLVAKFPQFDRLRIKYNGWEMPWNYYYDNYIFKIPMPGDRIGFEKGGIDNGLNYNHVFFDEANKIDFDKKDWTERSDHMNDALKYSFKSKDNWHRAGFKGLIIDALKDQTPAEKYKGWDSKQLSNYLNEALKVENYQLCAEIRDYAKERGINL